MPNSVAATVYFDYRCPFTYRLVRLLTEMERTRREIKVRWRHFSLEQLDAQNADWKLWEQPLDYETITTGPFAMRMLRAFLASHAASLQGVEAFARFRLAMFAAKHDEKKDAGEPEVVLEAARQAGLEMNTFMENWQSQEARDRLRDDHLSGQDVGAFGVPTVIINDSRPAYIRLVDYPPPVERDRFFDELIQLLTAKPYLQEFKRI